MNRYHLKWIAIITMAIDHIAAAGLIADSQTTFFMRCIGRIAFPLFAFFIAEGIFYTRDIKKYALRMLAFALITEIPFDYGLFHAFYYPSYQNVMWTFLLAIVGIMAGNYLIKTFGTKFGQVPLRLLGAVILMGCAYLAEFVLHTDYGMFGVLIVYVMYAMRSVKPMMIGGGILCIVAMSFRSPVEILAVLSFILIGYYNGEKGKDLKYFFYAFYPAHLALIGLILYLS